MDYINIFIDENNNIERVIVDNNNYENAIKIVYNENVIKNPCKYKIENNNIIEKNKIVFYTDKIDINNDNIVESNENVNITIKILNEKNELITNENLILNIKIYFKNIEENLELEINNGIGNLILEKRINDLCVITSFNKNYIINPLLIYFYD